MGRRIATASARYYFGATGKPVKKDQSFLIRNGDYVGHNIDLIKNCRYSVDYRGNFLKLFSVFLKRTNFFGVELLTMINGLLLQGPKAIYPSSRAEAFGHARPH
jgi:hypothetical protein